MSDDDPPLTIDRDPPERPPTMEEVLAAIGHETRARIVLELGDYSEGPTDMTGLSYTNLMERVGAEDSGRFNYHLDRLRESLVSKTDNGYWLDVNGHFVYQALVAGTLTAAATVPSLALDHACDRCDGPLRATYDLEQVWVVTCEECGRVHQHMEFPARGVEGRDAQAAFAAGVRYFNGQYASLRRGVCPACAGRVERDLLLPDEADRIAEVLPDEPAFAALGCTACSMERVGTPDVVALTTPAAVGFFDAHDRDAYSVSVLDLSEVVADLTVYDEPPVRAAVTFSLDGDERVVTLDRSLDVVTGPAAR